MKEAFFGFLAQNMYSWDKWGFPSLFLSPSRKLWSDQRRLAAATRGVGNIRRFVWRKKERRFRAINSAVRPRPVAEFSHICGRPT